MTFLPIVERELRVAARRPATHWARFFVALAVIVLGLIVILAGQPSAPAHRVGQGLFLLVGVVAFGVSLLSGVFLTADCLSIEKREGTLGLLFLTDLKGSDVVLGKLAATSVQSIYALLALLPMLGLPLLMGGVTGGEFGRLIMVLLTTLLLSLAAGMTVSAIARETRHTMILTFAVLVLLAGFSPVMMWMERVFFKGQLDEFLLMPSPVGALVFSFDSVYRAAGGFWKFWSSIGFLWLLGLAGLACASLMLPASWREKERISWPGAVLRRLLSFWQRRRAGGGCSPQERRAELEANPFRWFASRDRMAGMLAWSVVLAFGFLWLCFYLGAAFASLLSPGRNESFVVCFLVGYGLHVVFKTIVALEASRRFCEDHQSGALELVLVTPLPPRMMVRGQWQALRAQFKGPLLIALFVNAALLWLVAVHDPLGMSENAREDFCGIFCGGAALLLVDVYALSWVGMWLGARGKRHHRAVLATLGQVMVPSWLAILALVLSVYMANGISMDSFKVLVALWFLSSAVFSLRAAVTARRQLLHEFRRLATEPKIGAGPEPEEEGTPDLVGEPAVTRSFT